MSGKTSVTITFSFGMYVSYEYDVCDKHSCIVLPCSLASRAQMRSDAVVCQAASALVASFVALLRHAIRSMRSQAAATALRETGPALAAGSGESWVVEFVRRSDGYRYLEQLAEVGFLLIWESLLSCAGSECGMIDDMHVAVQVRYK